MSTMKMINLPLLVLFMLCYGLGHPALALLRPVSVEKTLVSFHHEVNGTALGFALSIARVFSAPSAAASDKPVADEPTTTVAQVMRAVPVSDAKVSRLVELPRKQASGFIVLTAR